MKKSSRMTWGPDQKSVAVSITFDNLGEAADIALGRWPDDAPIGHHYTATQVLPRLIETLADVPVTYFMEGVNAEMYPAAVQAWMHAGHEVGLHGWVHEGWETLGVERQREDLRKSLDAMRKLGVRPAGFRPPGGVIGAEGRALLREHGFRYCSLVSDHWGDDDEQGLQILPFQWRQVDAYLIDADLGQFRTLHGDPATPATAVEWRAALWRQWEAALAAGTHFVAIFHPYLFGAETQQWQVLMDFIEHVQARDDVWLASAASVADWLSTTRQLPA